MPILKHFNVSLATLSRSYMETSSFTKLVLSAVRKLYPEKLADSSFDNTGLLLEAPHRPNHLKNSVLLTIDLTRAVTDEAIARKDSVIISYHPIIFRPLKSLTSRNTQQTTLLRLAQEGISVYCPHTAIDAAPGGINDWLGDVVAGKELGSQISSSDRFNINPVKEAPVGFEAAGYGRIIRFHEPVKLRVIIERIMNGLKTMNGLNVAVPQMIEKNSKPNIKISSIGICAGSGGSMLKGLDVDLIFTGELSHHEALAAIEAGQVVITAGHSNTERKFLENRMRKLLLDGIRHEISHADFLSSDSHTAWEGIKVDVSKTDRDPFEVVRLGDEYWN